MHIRNILRNVALDIGESLADVFLFLRDESAFAKKGLLSTALTLRLKYLWRVKVRKCSPTSESFLGLKAFFFDYYRFIALFEDVFVHKPYEFHTNEPSPFIIDCGANIGMSIMFFKRLFPKCRIIAFEPDRQTFEMLRKNMETNGFEQTSLVNKAVYDHEGEIDFYYDPENLGSGFMSVMKERLPKCSEKVQAVRLSDYIDRNVDFLKLDVEGSEDVVIEDLAQHDKLRMVRQMVVEYHHNIRPGEAGLSHFLRSLHEHGFGYQIRTSLRPPWQRDGLQDILVYAYQK